VSALVHNSRTICVLLLLCGHLRINTRGWSVLYNTHGTQQLTVAGTKGLRLQ